MTHARDLQPRWRSAVCRVLALAIVTALLSACGINAETTDNVNDAVKLLQAIDDNGTWAMLSDALDLLDDQDGYLANVTVDTGVIDAEGSVSAPPEHTMTIAMRVGADGIAQYIVRDGDNTQQVLVMPPDDDDSTLIVYLVDEGALTCADAGIAEMLRDGPLSIVNSAALELASMGTLSVVEEEGESTRIEREATHYTITSRMDDALAILDATDNSALRQQVEQAGGFSISGTLDIDDSTGALLAFESMTSAADSGQWTRVRFEVTQWADVPAIDLSTGDARPACE